RTIPLEDKKAKLAAGRDKVIALSGNVLQRWNLSTGQQEAAFPVPVRGPVKAIAMGSASNGPLLICSEENGRAGQGRFDLYDIRTMSPCFTARRGATTPLSVRAGCRARASANGKVFTVWGEGANRWGARTLTCSGGVVSV